MQTIKMFRQKSFIQILFSFDFGQFGNIMNQGKNIEPKHILNGCNKDSQAVSRLIGTRTQIGLQGKVL